MRHFFYSLLILFITSCTSADMQGDVNLGSDYYYVVDPTFNSINLSTSKDDPMRVSSYIVKNIEYVGFDENFILAVSKLNDTLHYWVIDKTKKTSQRESTDSTNYISLRTKLGITMYSKEYYRKRYNYK